MATTRVLGRRKEKGRKTSGTSWIGLFTLFFFLPTSFFQRRLCDRNEDDDNTPPTPSSSKQKSSPKLLSLRTQMKSLLAQPLMAQGISTKYLTSGSTNVVDDLIHGSSKFPRTYLLSDRNLSHFFLFWEFGGCLFLRAILFFLFPLCLVSPFFRRWITKKAERHGMAWHKKADDPILLSFFLPSPSATATPRS